MSREPCPDRIVDDLGGAFGMGVVGGFVWHFGKGARNSPSGEKLNGAFYSARSRAPILGGNFAVWGGTFSTFDCSLQYVRRRDDHWNAIASGFLTGGVLAARGGWKAASKNAVIGGVLLGIIEGVAALIVRGTSSTPREQTKQLLDMEKKMKEGGGGGDFSSWMPFSKPGEGDAFSKPPESDANTPQAPGLSFGNDSEPGSDGLSGAPPGLRFADIPEGTQEQKPKSWWG
jgi:import inner membrane translocase subunit TIM17